MCAVVPLHAQGLTLANTQPLSFGTFVAGDGRITVDPSGARYASGGVVLLSSGPGSAAHFLLTGDADATYSVQLPADGVVLLVNGAYEMPLNVFTGNPGLAGQLSPSGTQVLAVGARMDVQNGQPAGEYAGSFEVVVDYN